MSYRHLTAQERYAISHLRSTFSIREIIMDPIIRRVVKRHSTCYPPRQIRRKNEEIIHSKIQGECRDRGHKRA